MRKHAFCVAHLNWRRPFFSLQQDEEGKDVIWLGVSACQAREGKILPGMCARVFFSQPIQISPARFRTCGLSMRERETLECMEKRDFAHGTEERIFSFINSSF